MAGKLVRIIKKHLDKKAQKKFKKAYPSCDIKSGAVLDSNTELEGLNVISSKADIRSSFIGKCTAIGWNTSLFNCKIGSFCSIASSIHIQPRNHPLTYISTYSGFYNTVNNYPFGKGNVEFKEDLKCDSGYYAEIGNDVWIGDNVIIKGGVHIGDGAVVGMGAVVTKDVPPYGIVGGVPAKVIKYRFDEETIKKLLEIKWWDWDIEKIKENRELFTNPTEFLEKFN